MAEHGPGDRLARSSDTVCSAVGGFGTRAGRRMASVWERERAVPCVAASGTCLLAGEFLFSLVFSRCIGDQASYFKCDNLSPPQSPHVKKGA